MPAKERNGPDHDRTKFGAANHEVVNAKKDHGHSDYADPDLRGGRNVKESEKHVRNEQQHGPEQDRVAGKSKQRFCGVAHDMSFRSSA